MPLWKLVSFGTSSWQTPAQNCLANRGRVTPSSRGRARVSSSVWRHHLHQYHALLSSGTFDLATDRLTLLLSYYYHIDFMNAVFVLFVYFNCYMFCSLLIFG